MHENSRGVKHSLLYVRRLGFEYRFDLFGDVEQQASLFLSGVRRAPPITVNVQMYAFYNHPPTQTDVLPIYEFIY